MHQPQPPASPRASVDCRSPDRLLQTRSRDLMTAWATMQKRPAWAEWRVRLRGGALLRDRSFASWPHVMLDGGIQEGCGLTPSHRNLWPRQRRIGTERRAPRRARHHRGPPDAADRHQNVLPDGVPLHSTVHRDVLYTNRQFLRQAAVALPIAEIAPSTGITAISSLTVAISEHLEAEELDGSRATHIATGGRELFDDLADVLSFRLNAVCSPDLELVRRLVPREREGSTAATQLFRGTFDPGVSVDEAELAGLGDFIDQLLGLRRPQFEAALRSIKRVMSASRRAVDDPTVAYTDIVAALEALSGTEEPVAATWDQLDGRRRALFDEVLRGADAAMALRVRSAAIEADRLGAKNRFVQFVHGHVRLTFFREEASSAAGPVGAIELKRAVRSAYDIRSRNVHALWNLPDEAWLLGRSSETVSVDSWGAS